MGIRNYAFWGPEQFSRVNWHLHWEEETSSQHVFALSSHAAQFHTSIGRDMCKAVHIFFEGLLYEMKIKSKYYLINDALKNPLSQELEYLGMITQAVSMAEYKVTVVIIGMIGNLNEKHLTASQLEKLLMNAWQFLKLNFSKWGKLNFCSKNLECSYDSKSVRLNSFTGFDSPDDIF